MAWQIAASAGHSQPATLQWAFDWTRPYFIACFAVMFLLLETQAANANLPRCLNKKSCCSRHCYLSGLGLESIPENVLTTDYARHKFTHLYLEKNNIARLSKTDLARLDGIEHLHLAYNPIKTLSIDLFRQNTNLKMLDLSHCKLRKIKAEHLTNTKLEILDLSYNILKSLEPYCFDLPALKTLSLKGNRLATLPKNVFINSFVAVPNKHMDTRLGPYTPPKTVNKQTMNELETRSEETREMETRNEEMRSEETGDKETGDKETRDDEIKDEETKDEEIRYDGDDAIRDDEMMNDETRDGETRDEETNDEETRDEETRHEETRDEETRDEETTDEETTDEETRDEEMGGEETRDEETRDDEIRNEETRNEEMRNEETRDEETLGNRNMFRNRHGFRLPFQHRPWSMDGIRRFTAVPQFSPRRPMMPWMGQHNPFQPGPNNRHRRSIREERRNERKERRNRRRERHRSNHRRRASRPNRRSPQFERGNGASPYGNSGLFSIKTLDLSYNKLQHIAPGVFDVPSLENLYMQSNRITNVSKGIFSKLDSLKELNLSRNMIKKVDRRSFGFRHLNNLTTLDLSHQPLRVIEPNAFGSGGLENLYLERCQLVSILKGVFTGLSKLKSLHLQDQNINRIAPNAFVLPSLQILNLQGNKLANLEESSFSMPSLITLNVSNNRLHTIRLGAFYLPRLESMDLGRNKIHKFKVGRGDMRSLQELNLVENNLSRLPPFLFDHFPKLSTLHLHSNNWHCNTMLCGWLSYGLSKLSDWSPAVCKSPQFMAGTKLRTLCSLEEPDFCNNSFHLIENTLGDDTVDICEAKCKGEGWSLAIPQTQHEFTCLVKLAGRNRPVWTGMLVKGKRFFTRHPQHGKAVNLGQDPTSSKRFYVDRFVGVEEGGEPGKSSHPVYLENGEYVAAYGSTTEIPGVNRLPFQCACQMTSVPYKIKECSNFFTLDNTRRMPVEECERKCTETGDGWGLAVPTTRKEYSCLVNMAGGKNHPVWTGLRASRTEFVGRSPSGNKFEGTNFGKRVPRDLRKIYDDYVAFMPEGDTESKNGLYPVYLHKGLYVAAAGTYEHAGPEEPIKCGCQLQKFQACKAPKRINNAKRIFNSTFFETRQVFYKCEHDSDSFSPSTNFFHKEIAVQCSPNNKLETFPKCEEYHCLHPAVKNSKIKHQNSTTFKHLDAMIDMRLGEAVAVKCRKGFSFHTNNSRHTMQVISCSPRGTIGKVSHCIRVSKPKRHPGRRRKIDIPKPFTKTTPTVVSTTTPIMTTQQRTVSMARTDEISASESAIPSAKPINTTHAARMFSSKKDFFAAQDEILPVSSTSTSDIRTTSANTMTTAQTATSSVRKVTEPPTVMNVATPEATSKPNTTQATKTTTTAAAKANVTGTKPVEQSATKPDTRLTNDTMNISLAVEVPKIIPKVANETSKPQNLTINATETANTSGRKLYGHKDESVQEARNKLHDSFFKTCVTNWKMVAGGAGLAIVFIMVVSVILLRRRHKQKRSPKYRALTMKKEYKDPAPKQAAEHQSLTAAVTLTEEDEDYSQIADY